MPKIKRDAPAEPQSPAKPAPPLIGEPTGLYDQDHDTDFEQRQAAKEKTKKKKRRGDLLYTAAILVCLAVFLVSGGLLAKRYFDDRRVEGEFADLAALIDEGAVPAADPDAPVSEEPGNAAKFAALQAQNADFVGWLSIPGTNLDYPVMYAPDNKDFYLRHDFAGAYSVYGVPYLDEKTVFGGTPSQNLIVYGHNMKTGTIFGCLTGYRSADYYAQHPRIVFDTVYGDAEYEVFAAFAIDVIKDPGFVYNEYINMDEEKYNAYLDEVLRRSDVQTGIRPQYGEQLLTLSTCEYSTDNGRYVVVGRRVAG